MSSERTICIEKTLYLDDPERVMQSLGSANCLGKYETELLQEYQSIDGTQEGLRLRRCALEAFALVQIGHLAALRLTEWGITFKDRMAVGYREYRDEHGRTVESDDAATKREEGNEQLTELLIALNHEFLHEWDSIRKEQRKKHATMQQGAAAIQEETQRAIDAYESVFITPIVIANALCEDGFTIENPEELAKKPSVMQRQGVYLRASNASGVLKEVTFMPDTTLHMHVHTPEGDEACEELSKSFARQIGSVLQNLGASFGTDVLLQTKSLRKPGADHDGDPGAASGLSCNMPSLSGKPLTHS